MKNLLTLILVTLTISLSAQQVEPTIGWGTKVHDFGEINESGGKVSYTFKFTNTGGQPLVITNVRPSCGCTSSDYSKAPIAPGAEGYVTATYNPLRRPGKFSKTIAVTSNAKPASTTLRFTGNVIAKPKTKEERYPRQVGKLNIKTNHLAFATTHNTQVKTDSIPMANLTDETLNIAFENTPNHLKITAHPKSLKAGQTGYIEIVYNASKKNDWGFVMDKVTVSLNGDTNEDKNKFSVSASISEDFSKMTASQIDKAPKATFKNKVFNFGTINQGEIIKHSFNFTNEGQSPLIIRKSKSSCSCLVFDIKDTTIKPGQSGSIEVTFDSRNRKNRQNKSLTLITNDPNNAQLSLRITGTVEETK